jgi:multidrug efflux pump subunit AcrA (membrane-fusion protein)
LRGPTLLGAAILLGFFVIGGGWAATAPLSGAAIAPGVVSPEGSRRRVQHLEGGIIREIRVSDGDRGERATC